MSYEGYTEYLCNNGHLTQQDAMYEMYVEEVKECCRCHSSFIFRHSVDQTNGIEYQENGEPYPDTISYPFEENGFEDVWHKDHYGNKYAVKVILYKIPEKCEN